MAGSPLSLALASWGIPTPKISGPWSTLSKLVGSMSLNLGTLNARGLRDPSKCSCLLGELSTLGVDFLAVQETHFTFAEDWRVLEDDLVVLSAYSNRSSVGIPLLVGRSLNADVNLVLASWDARDLLGALPWSFCSLSYLADFPCLGLVTKCGVWDTLKQVSLNKSPGLDGLFVLFWWICSTIGSHKEPSVVALTMAGSHCWGKVAGTFGRT